MNKYAMQTTSIGDRIKEVREKIILDTGKSINQANFAKELLFRGEEAKTTISQLENGHIKPTANFLIELNRRFGVSPDYILFGKNSDEVQTINSVLNSRDSLMKNQFIDACKSVAKEIIPIDELDYFDEEEYLGYRDTDDENNVCCSSLRIKKLRKIKGLSVLEVANKCGVYKSSAYRWEKSPCEPKTGTLISLHDEFGFSADYILLGVLMSYQNKLLPYFQSSTYENQTKLLTEFCKIADVFLQEKHNKKSQLVKP